MRKKYTNSFVKVLGTSTPVIVEIGEKGGSIPMPSNKFEVLKSRVMNVGEESGRETRDPKEY